MDYARSRCSAHGDELACEVSICDGREDTVFFISNMHKVDVSVSAQRIDHGIQGVAHNAVTPLYAGVNEHFPQDIRNVSGHRNLFFLLPNKCKYAKRPPP